MIEHFYPEDGERVITISKSIRLHNTKYHISEGKESYV
jgi:hypothetical protein